jgi:tetratricopeptide (TPR) repeat protein
VRGTQVAPEREPSDAGAPGPDPREGAAAWASRPGLVQAAALVFAATFACFLPALRNGLLAWDDAGYITQNPHIRSLSLETVRWAFGEFWCNDWAPLTWLSLAADHAVWGLDPVGYHLTNVALHAANAALFLVLARRLLGAREGALATATLAALLFALHPLRVESVAWAVERKDVLSVFFGLLAALAWLAHTQGRADRAAGRARGPAGETSARSAAAAEARLLRTRVAYPASVALYAASLCTKAGLVPLPAVLLVLDWFPLRRFRTEGARRLLLEKVPYLLVAAPVAWLTVQAHAPQTKTLAQVDLPTRVVLAARALLEYLRLTVLPYDVSPAYLHPGNIGPLHAGHVLAVLAALALMAGAALAARRLPAIAAAWAVCLLTLAPVSGLLQNGPQWMAGRFTYVPSMALALVAALGATALVRSVSSGAARGALFAAGAAALLACAALTVRDLGWWRDDVTLWTRAIELAPRASGKQYAIRAAAYRARGEYPRALADLDAALAIAHKKGYAAAHEIVAARARVLRDMGETDAAIAELGRALESAEGADARAYLMERAALHQARGDAARAEEDLRLASSPERP